MLISKNNTDNISKKIASFEEKKNIVFPAVYKEFLEKYNGGETVDTTWTGKKKSDVREFFGFATKGVYSDIEKIVELEMGADLLNKGLFPVACNVFGDYFCINLSDESMWFAYHDSHQRIQIASDFREFISKCKSQKIGHIRTIEERKAGLIAAGLEDKFSENMLKGWQAEIDKYSNIVQEEVEI